MDEKTRLKVPADEVRVVEGPRLSCFGGVPGSELWFKDQCPENTELHAPNNGLPVAFYGKHRGQAVTLNSGVLPDFPDWFKAGLHELLLRLRREALDEWARRRQAAAVQPDQVAGG